jgi:hypothetical protein
LEKERQKEEKKKKKSKSESEALPEGSRSFKPMTKEEWEKRQSVVRRVFDDDTGSKSLAQCEHKGAEMEQFIFQILIDLRGRH